jgi:hypothetical protein
MRTLGFAPTKKTLGQLNLAAGVTSSLAKRIVSEAEPATRRIIRDERNRFAGALIGGVPFAALSALAFVGTSYVVPPGALAWKAAGYSASAIFLAVGAWWVLDELAGPPTPEVPPSGPSAIDPVVQKTAQEIVAEAEPKIRDIIAEERGRAAEALLAGLPFAVASAAAFAATAFLVDQENRAAKTIGYSGSALLMGAAAWTALERERAA